MVQKPQRTVWQLLKKANIILPHDPAPLLLPKYLPTGNENMLLYTNAHSSFIHKWQKTERI